MKKLLLITCVATIGILISCSDNAEDPGIDCTQSDLTISVASQVQPECAIPGSLTVAATGGTSPYIYSLDGGASQSTTTFDGLATGSYTITVTDSDGCTATANATLAAADGAITVSLASTDSECGNDVGTITATATGGDGNYMYSLDGGSSQASGQFDDVSNGSHEVEVTDGDGCNSTATIIVSSGVSYSGDIQSIITANCAVSGCHNGDNSSIPNWTNFTLVQENATKIKTRTGSRSMPPSSSGRSLTDGEIELIACWVDDGAVSN